MSKLNRPVIPISFEHGWTLVRDSDGLTKKSAKVAWIEFNEDGTFKASHDTPSVGRSLLMSPFNPSFTWQTTVITEILELSQDFVRFKTENSTYTLSQEK